VFLVNGLVSRHLLIIFVVVVVVVVSRAVLRLISPLNIIPLQKQVRKPQV
jgi:hypothetical protein